MGKTFLGLDLAVSVASGTPFLGRFPVEQSGPTLAYLAEDSLAEVRERVAGFCRHRRLDLAALALHVITEPTLRLDRLEDQQRLWGAADRLRPSLLLLDPLVRLHALNENSSQEISALLGYLRQLQRTFDMAVVLVHHTSKRYRRCPGQALRGSSDLHAWLDVGAYLTSQEDRLQLTFEHRATQAPAPLHLALTQHTDGTSAHLEVLDLPEEPSRVSLGQRILSELQTAGGPLRRGDLRCRLRVQNSRLGDALEEMQRRHLLLKTPKGWELPSLVETTS